MCNVLNLLEENKLAVVVLDIANLKNEGIITPHEVMRNNLMDLAKLGAIVKKEFMYDCPLPKSIDCKKCKLKNLCSVMDCRVVPESLK